ncbi:MAG TPA: recombinase family protein, partial [Streptosporangiaceae bacterium]|nr:recombinase family protein [Streptosporangiaceae bacterium]
MSEPAGIWVRVSTGGQDEANQVPDVERHCAEHGYTITRRYELNDKSASKGEQQEKQDEVIEDIRDGTIRALVCWHSDRVERRGPEALFGFIRKIKDAGGRVESTKEPLLGTEDLSGEVVTALNAVFAHQYSVHLGEQVRASHERIRANGGLVAGGTPWGYVIEGDKYSKTLVPTGQGREVIPQIFARCADGDSCRTIARWLQSEKIPTMRGGVWSEGSVHRIITNMTYAGRRQDEGEIKPNGKPSRKNRRTIMSVEAVVTMDIWQRANDALHNRPHRGPGAAAKMPNRPMLAGLKCARCGSPMWRIMTGRPEQRRAYYRCYGSGPQRTGCGNMVPLTQADTIVVVRIFITSTTPYSTRHWVEGESYDDEIANTKQDLREALESERWADMPALQDRLDDLRGKQEHATRGHYEKTYVRRSD